MSRKEKGIRKFKFVTKTQFFWIFVGGLLWISIGWIRMNEWIDENKDGRKDGSKDEWIPEECEASWWIRISKLLYRIN